MGRVLSVIILGLIIFSSCKTTTPSGLRLKKLRSPTLIEKIENQQKRPEWFGAKYKGKISLDNKRISIGGHMRLKKDSLMWFNVKVFGFEVARAQASKDSIWFINRYSKEYYKGALPKQYMNFNSGQLYQLLEDIITNQMAPLENYAYESDININDYQLSYHNNGQKLNYLIDPIDFFINNIALEDKSQNFSFDYNLEDYKAEGEYLFGYKRKISVDLPKSTVKLDLNLSNIKVDVPQEMPFKIPQKYTQVYKLSLGM